MMLGNNKSKFKWLWTANSRWLIVIGYWGSKIRCAVGGKTHINFSVRSILILKELLAFKRFEQKTNN